MLSKIVLVVSLLFFLVDGAKYKVSNNNLRNKLSKEDKIKAVTQFKEHFASVTGKLSNKDKDASVLKRVEEVKKLESWYPYDSAYSSAVWTVGYLYQTALCSGDVIAQTDSYSSLCYVGTFEGSNGETYESARELFNSDCSSKTYAFYDSATCSGTPTAQANTVGTGINATSPCMENPGDGDDDFLSEYLSMKILCAESAMPWVGGSTGTFQVTEYVQTETCNNQASTIVHLAGGCYQTSDTSSIKYAEGPTVNTYLYTSDCSGNYFTFVFSGCIADDDGFGDDEDDDNMIDDAMFTDVTANLKTSNNFAWSGSSMGAVLNYSLSAALVLMSCTLFF